MSAVVPPIVPLELRTEGERLLMRYLQEIVEPFSFCPWAKATRGRDELWVEIAVSTALATLAAQLGQFVRASEPVVETAEGTAPIGRGRPVATIGMIVFAASNMSSKKLLEVRDLLLAHAGVQEKLGAWPGLVIADFHPAAAEPDLRSPSRLLPFVRRSPDPMLQVARRTTIEAVSRGGAIMIEPSAQLAALIGHKTLIGQSTADEIASRNFETMRAQAHEVQAISDAIARDRAETYARLGLL